MRLKWSKTYGNHKTQFPKLNVFVRQKSTLLHYYSQNFKDGIQIRVCSMNKEGLVHFRKFISVKVKEILGNSQAQLREKL